MFAGLTVLAARTTGPVWLVLVAAVTATLPTFASLSAAGAGTVRANGGPLGKTERCAAAVVAAAAPALLGWVAAVIVTGSLVTAATRLAAARRALNAAAGVPR